MLHDDASDLDTGMPPLDHLMHQNGVRSVEIDIVPDPQGGRACIVCQMSQKGVPFENVDGKTALSSLFLMTFHVACTLTGCTSDSSQAATSMHVAQLRQCLGVL